MKRARVEEDLLLSVMRRFVAPRPAPSLSVVSRAKALVLSLGDKLKRGTHPDQCASWLPPFPLLQYRRLLTRNRVVRSQPTKADARNVVQIIASNEVKTQAYCDLIKLEGQVKAVQQNDTKAVETLTKQAELLIDKLGP